MEAKLPCERSRYSKEVLTAMAFAKEFRAST